MKNNIFNLLKVFLFFLIITGGGNTITLSAQQSGKRIITGQVIDDENQEPLIGVSVLVVGTTTGTITDFDGNYSVELPAGSKQLQFSYIGYASQTVNVSANVLNIRLKSDTEMLSDVVVIGYGTQRKSDLTGSVTNVSSEDFNTGLVSSPEQLINGKISGVQIMSNSGSPTAGSTIRVRGGASLNASNDPLIVLDGVPLEQGGISGNDGNFLSLINPNDIESMTILKDASSTAIYGSRASNGVIIITTKKGNSDKLKVTFSTTNSIQTRTRMADMLSYDQFVNVVKTQGSAAQQALLGTANTDWNDQVYHNAFGTDNNLSLAGRIAPNWPIRVSVGYYNQDGLLKTDNAERFTGSLSLSPSFFDDHLKLTINAKGSLNKNQFANTSAIWGASTMNPTIPVYSGTDAFGGFTEAITGDGSPVTGGVRNPVGLLEQRDAHSKVVRFIGNFDVDYRLHFFPDLKLHATLGYDYAEGKGSEYVSPEAAQYYTTGGYYYPYGPQKNENRLLTLYANYNKFVDTLNSSFDATVGYDYQYWKSATPATTQMNAAGEIQTQYRASDQRHVLLSYYGRLNYSYGSRYMLTATVRRDATSRFAQSQRWGTFPSVALGWRVTEESFMKDQQVLSNLKLRASYGVTGQQDGIGNYNYLPVYTISQDGAQGIVGGTPIYTYRPEAYVSDLKWETTKQTDIGIDLSVLGGRISLVADYYYKKTVDLHYDKILPYYTGYSSQTQNIGSKSNKGWEFSLNTQNLVGDFKWSTSLNIALNREKVLDLGDDEYFYTNGSGGALGAGFNETGIVKVGEPLGNFYGYVFDGIYQNEAEAKALGLTKDDVGSVKFKDLNGDNKITTEDRTIIGNANPDFIFGIGNDFSYKNFDLSFMFQGTYGNDVYNLLKVTFSELPSNSNNTGNAFAFVKDSWRGEGTSNTQQAFNKGVGPSSSRFVEDGSYIRLKNLTFGYTLPKSVTSKWGISNLRFYLSGQNLFTITGYSGYDPEVSSRTGNYNLGFDGGSYPATRSYTFGLNLTL